MESTCVKQLENNNRRKNQCIYQHVNNKTRVELYKKVHEENVPIRDAAKLLKIKYSTAKTIMRIFKIENRLLRLNKEKTVKIFKVIPPVYLKNRETNHDNEEMKFFLQLRDREKEEIVTFKKKNNFAEKGAQTIEMDIQTSDFTTSCCNEYIHKPLFNYGSKEGVEELKKSLNSFNHFNNSDTIINPTVKFPLVDIPLPQVGKIIEKNDLIRIFELFRYKIANLSNEMESNTKLIHQLISTKNERIYETMDALKNFL